jgi:hypothetical protein
VSGVQIAQERGPSHPYRISDFWPPPLGSRAVCELDHIQ